MSTLPGPETWRDAGLDQVDPGGDVEIARGAPPEPADAPDRYDVAEANPADVAEQALAVTPDVEGAPPPADADVLAEANPADVAEQAQSVPPDERDEYP